MAHRVPRPPREGHPGRTRAACLLLPGAVILVASAGLFMAALLMR